MNIEYTPASAEVESWVRASLRSDLALRLAQLIESQLCWSGARYRVLAARGLPRAAVLQFEVGGKVSGTPSSDEWLLRQLAPRLGSHGFLIAEDWLANPADAFLAQRVMPAIFWGDQVYYVVRGDPACDPNWQRICTNTVPTFHMFLVDGDTPSPQPGASLTEDALVQIAGGVRQVVLGIYDGESYLIVDL